MCHHKESSSRAKQGTFSDTSAEDEACSAPHTLSPPAEMASTANDGPPDAVVLSARALHELSQVTQDIRSTVARVAVPSVSALAVVDAAAVDAVKDLYYMLNIEDPMNAMPARKLLGDRQIVASALLPLLAAVHSDPAADANPKRWSVPIYQVLRLLSLLSIPISRDNVLLKPGCNLDAQLLQMRADLSAAPRAVHALVALLQYYIERKADKTASFATAEQSKVEDARIDNLLRFFRNILAPPRDGVTPDFVFRDRGVHFALVGALVDADFYSTLVILFSSREDAQAQYTDLVYTVADIYAHTYRHSTPADIASYSSRNRFANTGKRVMPGKENVTPSAGKSTAMVHKLAPSRKKHVSVFDKLRDDASVADAADIADATVKPRRERIHQAYEPKGNASTAAAGLRAAMQRERSLIGGGRAVTATARWTSRYSGGFQAMKKAPNSVAAESAAAQRQQTSSGAGGPQSGSGGQTQQTQRARNVANAFSKNAVSKRVVSAHHFTKKNNTGSEQVFQEGMLVTSEMLCLLSTKRRSKIVIASGKSMLSSVVRADLQRKGQVGISMLTKELIESSFSFFSRELRERIEEARARNVGATDEVLQRAQQSYLVLVAIVVGFQRELCVKGQSKGSNVTSKDIHKSSMEATLAANCNAVGIGWEAVEAGVEVESFKMVFRVLVEASEGLKIRAKDLDHVKDLEMATFAVREMMKMLQGMAVETERTADESKQATETVSQGDDETSRRTKLTARETALNTLEELFEREEYLNAPSDLAKDFDPKVHSFRHLANVIEVSYAFTSTLLDESELARIQVQKTKKTRTSRPRTSAANAAVKHDSGVDVNHGDPARSDRDASNISAGDVPSAFGFDNVQAEDDDCKLDDAEGVNAESEDRATGNQDSSCGQLATGKLDDENDTLELADSEEEDAKIITNGDGDYGVHEIESTGVIRRFANAKALQALTLPLRAALCGTSSLTGSILPVPEGSSDILGADMAAKSLAVIRSVWNVVRQRERGALRGHFYSYGLLHLLSVAMAGMSQTGVVEGSVLHSLASFGREVTQGFFGWLALNPGLTLDCLFFMDKGTCLAYAGTAHQKQQMLDEQNCPASEAEDGHGDSDHSLASYPSDIDIGYDSRMESGSEERQVRKSRSVAPRKRRTVAPENAPNRHRKLSRRRRHHAKDAIDEDEDVDDFDALEFGIKHLGGDGKDADGSSPSDYSDDGITPDIPKAKSNSRGSRKQPAIRGSKRTRRSIPDDNGDISPDESSEDSDIDLGMPLKKRRSAKSSKSIRRAGSPTTRLDGPALRQSAKQAKTTKTSRVVACPNFSSSDEYDEAEIGFIDEDETGGIGGARLRPSCGEEPEKALAKPANEENPNRTENGMETWRPSSDNENVVMDDEKVRLSA